jgi:hypothetical protein
MRLLVIMMVVFFAIALGARLSFQENTLGAVRELDPASRRAV